MTDEKKFVEIKAPTVDAAIENGLVALGVTRDEVDVEVLEDSRDGFLGLGSREAVVRLVVKPTAVEEVLPGNDSADTQAADDDTDDEMEDDEFFDDLDDLPDPELLEEQELAHEILQNVIDKMGFEATVKSELSEKDDMDKQIVYLNVTGDDTLNELIGRRGDTLATLQYVVRLMVSQQVKRRVEFNIDIDGYRERKEAGLAKLALRMAGKATQRNSPVTLEPMNSYERRLVHVALRDNEDVYTKSIGQGDDRRVRIHPKD